MPNGAHKNRRRTGGVEHDPELWRHIESESSRRLLLSAVEAFSARGFHAATTREIGEGAGLSAAGVYVHYKSKSDLLYEISRIGHDASLATVQSALERASDDAVERVSSFVFAFAKWHADNHVLARVIQYEFKNLPTRQFRKIVAIRNRFEELMRDELRSGTEANAFQVTNLEGTTPGNSLDVHRSRALVRTHARTHLRGRRHALYAARHGHAASKTAGVNRLSWSDASDLLDGRGPVERPTPRERLLDAADELFDEEGICTVGVDRVLKRADVARASLYTTYGSKEELVGADPRGL